MSVFHAMCSVSSNLHLIMQTALIFLSGGTLGMVPPKIGPR